MGIFATIIMDFAAGILAKRKIIQPFITQEAIGRWFLYIFKGKFIHEDINKAPKLKNEKLWCFISHYLIGICLAGAYLFAELVGPVIQNKFWVPLVYGIITVFLPWFWLLPSTGYGFMASKTTNRLAILRTNLINHTNFGIGLLLWTQSIHHFF